MCVTWAWCGRACAQTTASSPLASIILRKSVKNFALGNLARALAGHALIDVTQGNDISVGRAGQLTPAECPLVADANDAHADPLARRGGRERMPVQRPRSRRT